MVTLTWLGPPMRVADTIMMLEERALAEAGHEELVIQMKACGGFVRQPVQRLCSGMCTTRRPRMQAHIESLKAQQQAEITELKAQLKLLQEEAPQVCDAGALSGA